MRLDAILRNLHIVGEAVKNLPMDLRERHPDVPWREIAGMRDFVAHAYFSLDFDILWSAIQGNVPQLGHKVELILESERQKDSQA
jgi:uncharacterized protein with HEPN domain